jgi:glycosyltransferase involved in cell wall biosynthesis
VRPGRRRRARIAFFDAYSLSAGAGIALRDIIARIDRERFEPRALLPRDGPLVEMLRAIDCPSDVIAPPPPLDVCGGRLGETGAGTAVRTALALARYSATVAGWLRTHRIDLLHCNQTRAVFEAGPGARLAGVPVAWNVRIRERLPLPVVRLCEECSDLIIPLTRHDFSGLRDETHLLSRSTVIRNAVDTQRFTPTRNEEAARRQPGVGEGPVVLSAGLLVPRKGFDVLIRAMARVLRAIPDATLLVAGGEPDARGGCRADLQDLITALEPGEGVRLLGHREDMPELLAACDVFALASRHEGDPAVVLEAMATGRPVVATGPAAAAVRDGATGVVVPEDDVGALAEAILRLLGDSALSQRMGRRARAVVEREHDIRAMVRRYEAAWTSLLT